MSIGHGSKYGGIRAPKELAKILAEEDTKKLLKRRVETDFRHDVPLGFGISVDAKTVYGDRGYVAEVRSGRVRVSGLSADQIIAAHVCHEVTEKAIVDGDNPVDIYEGAHPYAETAEHEEVKRVRGSDDGYEEALKPALDRCFARKPERPPLDLWCGPLHDESDKDDKEMLRVLRSKGVKDADKSSKRNAGYMIGKEQCKDCAHFLGDGVLEECDLVSGLVRADRQCDWWEKGKSDT